MPLNTPFHTSCSTLSFQIQRSLTAVPKRNFDLNVLRPLPIFDDPPCLLANIFPELLPAIVREIKQALYMYLSKTLEVSQHAQKLGQRIPKSKQFPPLAQHQLWVNEKDPDGGNGASSRMRQKMAAECSQKIARVAIHVIQVEGQRTCFGV